MRDSEPHILPEIVLCQNWKSELSLSFVLFLQVKLEVSFAISGGSRKSLFLYAANHRIISVLRHVMSNVIQMALLKEGLDSISDQVAQVQVRTLIGFLSCAQVA